jgi:hypothetical protein
LEAGATMRCFIPARSVNDELSFMIFVH